MTHDYTDVDLEARRRDMIERLHNDKCWFSSNDDWLITCPICGVVVILAMKLVHITWHEVNDA